MDCWEPSRIVLLVQGVGMDFDGWIDWMDFGCIVGPKFEAFEISIPIPDDIPPRL